MNKEERSSYIVLTRRQGTGRGERGADSCQRAMTQPRSRCIQNQEGLSLNQGYILLFVGRGGLLGKISNL